MRILHGRLFDPLSTDFHEDILFQVLDFQYVCMYVM